MYIGSSKNTRFSLFSALPLLGLMISLLMLGILDVFVPSVISALLSGTNVARVLVPAFQGLIVGVITVAILVVLRQNELIAVIVVAAHLYVDWYLGLTAVVPILSLLLLFILYFARSPQHPWVEPHALWLWLLLLAFAISPAIQGALGLFDALYYYPNIIFGALIMFWLGSVVARDDASLRRLFRLLAVLGTFLAVTTIIQANTGVLLLGTSRFENFLASAGNFQLANGLDVRRLGSFFVDPNWNACFLALLLCVPLGLFVTSSSALEKIICLIETFLILVALLFTYSAGGWIGAIVGVAAFTLLGGRAHHRVLIPILALISAVGILALFPGQVNLLFQHATRSDDLASRVGAWETALNVIRAFPLTGIGLSKSAYAQRTDPYRSVAQTIPLDHPHNSYLELAAMAGLPVLLIFVALILIALLHAFRNWQQAGQDNRRGVGLSPPLGVGINGLAGRGQAHAPTEPRGGGEPRRVPTRPLLAAGIASIVALSVNSFSINGWTLPPLAAFAWLILGAVSSPLLARHTTQEEKKSYIAPNIL